MNIIRLFKKCKLTVKIIILIYIGAFIGATCNHIIDIFNYGLMYTEIDLPAWVRVYWTLLTLADPVSVIILILNVKRGIISFYLVIVSDVIINFCVQAIFNGFLSVFNFFMAAQFIFMIFLVLTSKMVLREAE